MTLHAPNPRLVAALRIAKHRKPQLHIKRCFEFGPGRTKIGLGGLKAEDLPKDTDLSVFDREHDGSLCVVVDN